MADDSFYIEKVQQGDVKYFEFLVKKYQAHLFNVVNKYVQNYAISEDIIQEVFFRAYKGIRNFQADRPFSLISCRLR